MSKDKYGFYLKKYLTVKKIINTFTAVFLLKLNVL